MKLILTDNYFLGRGTNKIVYYHPQDQQKCIKFSQENSDGNDMKAELRYRKTCKDKVEHSTLLTKYYGAVDTNFGEAHVFELVRDFDGKISESFLNFLLREKNSPKVLEVLTRFKEKMFEERIITYKIFPDNILAQRISEQEYRLRIIDGIGMHVLVPIAYFSETIAKKRQKRIWNNFVKMLCDGSVFQSKRACAEFSANRISWDIVKDLQIR